MANENNNINELVSDDDPTSELEAITWRREAESAGVPIIGETEARTFDVETPDRGGDSADRLSIEPSIEPSIKPPIELSIEPLSTDQVSITELRSDLESRSATIDRLQFDLEQLRARWLGLEAEIQAREEIAAELTAELQQVKETLARKDKLIEKRDRNIKSLKAEIRQRETDHRALMDSTADLEETLAGRQDRIEALESELDTLRGQIAKDRSEVVDSTSQTLEKQAGRLLASEMLVAKLRAQLARNERYADSIRGQLEDRRTAVETLERKTASLTESLESAEKRNTEISASLDGECRTNAELSSRLADIERRHEEEIRQLRFELGDAQETATQQESLNEQLQSNLTEARGYHDELERMLSRSEEMRLSRTEELEQRIEQLRAEVGDHEQKLQEKSSTINCLLEELTKKTDQIESIGELEDVIHDIDDRMSERLREQPAPDAPDRERVSRLLIGTVDGQEVRFPLFKDRLTIGRTGDNDIQLKAPYISRRHAVVVSDRGAARVVDWGSRNGVYVNSKRITEHFLVSGDVVTIGTSQFRYEERPKPDA